MRVFSNLKPENLVKERDSAKNTTQTRLDVKVKKTHPRDGENLL
jgi:hypothetical protein